MQIIKKFHLPFLLPLIHNKFKMLGKSILVLLVLSLMQCKELSMQQRYLNSHMLLQLGDCSSNVDLSITCDNDSCSVSVEEDVYSASVDLIDGDFIYVTVTDSSDSDDSEDSEDCTEVVTASVECEDDNDCVFDDFALVVVTLPDGSQEDIVASIV